MGESEDNKSDEDRLKEVIRLLKLAIAGCQSALADIEETGAVSERNSEAMPN